MYTKEVRSNERSNEQTIHRLLQEKKKEIKAEIRFSRVALVLIENDIPRGNGKENIARPRTRFHIARQIVIVRAYGRRFWCKWAVLLMLRRRQDEARGCTWVQHARLAAVSFGRATCLSYETVAWETTILHCCLHTCLCVYVCVCPRISVPLRNYRAEHWCRSWCCCASSSFVSHVVYDTLFRIYLFIHVAATSSSSRTFWTRKHLLLIPNNFWNWDCRRSFFGCQLAKYTTSLKCSFSVPTVVIYEGTNVHCTIVKRIVSNYLVEKNRAVNSRIKKCFA